MDNSQSKDSFNITSAIEEYFKFQRRRVVIQSSLTLALLLLGTAIATASLLYCLHRDENKEDNVYVLADGSAYPASLMEDRSPMLEAELSGHVTRFHELMFDLSPDLESISQKHMKAYFLCDQSGRDYHNDMQESGFYTRLVSTGSMQRLKIDSLKTDIYSSPMTARVFGKLYILRQSTIAMYDFESSCRVLLSERTPTNPHGLQIENFLVEKSALIETRRRD